MLGDNINACRLRVGNPEEMKHLEYLIKDMKTIMRLIVKKIL
jgi:hypothetical protein